MAMAGGAPPAPLPVVGHQFCAPYVVPLTVTKKALSLSDGDFAITDANGAVVLKVKGAIFSIRSRRTILDGAGMPLLTMQEKMSRKLTVSNVLLGRDTFSVTVFPHVDYVFIASLVVILDEVHRDKHDNN